MGVRLRSVRIYEDDYQQMVRIQGFLQMRDGELLSMPEIIHKVLAKYAVTGKLPAELFRLEKVKK